LEVEADALFRHPDHHCLEAERQLGVGPMEKYGYLDRLVYFYFLVGFYKETLEAQIFHFPLERPLSMLYDGFRMTANPFKPSVFH
jgi:hypothetical protein